jgi:hypothetical protein
MLNCLERELEIEDLRSHSQEMIRELRDALAFGATLVRDPKRVGFYELKRGERSYYIFVSLQSEKVLLIASWNLEESLPAEVEVSP